MSVAAIVQQGRISDADIDHAKGSIVATISNYVDLKKAGKDFLACCPFHSERTPSFTVSETKGIYHCFGCGAHGDAIDFVMQHEGVPFHEAVQSIVGNMQAGGVAPQKRTVVKQESVEEWKPITPVPGNAGAPMDVFNRRKGDDWEKLTASRKWAYRDAAGALLGYVFRFDLPGGGKDVLPQSYCLNSQTGEMRWKWQSFSKPRPIFGLDKLAAHPMAQVVVIEGEKACEAGQALFEGLGISRDKLVTVSWPGGGKAVKHVDWTALAGRKVGLLPDADQKPYVDTHPKAGERMPLIEQPGTVCMVEIAGQIEGVATEVKFIMPPSGVPDGWDIADPMPEGLNLLAYLKLAAMPMQEFRSKHGINPAPTMGTANQPDEVDAQEVDVGDEQAGPADAVAQMQADRSHRKSAPKQENSADFGEPIDLFGVSMPPQVPLSALPASIAAYAKDQSALLGSDHSIVAMTALVAAAACITDGIKLQPKRMDPTWTESARLWVGVVGDPSTKKSPSISKAVRHVKRLEARLAEKNAAAYGDWKARHEEWKLEKKESKGRNAAQEPAAPPMKRLIVEDTTVEALGVVLNDNDRGVLCLQDELTGWFAGMDAYKSGGGRGANRDRAHWLEAYNGGPRSIDRVGRESLTIPNWSVCMIGGIQPDMMRRIANGMGNDGLLQRFMILVARPSQKGEDRYPDRTAMDQFAALFDHLEALEPADESVTMSEAAHQARERIEVFADKMIRAFDHPHMQAWLGKWEGLFARLVLLYHIIECAEESIYPTTKKVTGETAEKVERLMCGTLLHHAIHFYQEVVDAHDRQSNMRQLARLILARGMSVVTKRDIHLYWRASRKLQQWEVKAVIDGLCNLDWLRPDETSLDVVDGKPKTWFVNPAVHTTFADHAERERIRREEAVEAMRELKRAYAEA